MFKLIPLFVHVTNTIKSGMGLCAAVGGLDIFYVFPSFDLTDLSSAILMSPKKGGEIYFLI